jgi:hypothetical protein
MNVRESQACSRGYPATLSFNPHIPRASSALATSRPKSREIRTIFSTSSAFVRA